MLYTTLDEASYQVRLVSLLPANSTTEAVHCVLETVSLLSYVPTYERFASKLSSARKKRAFLSEWVKDINHAELGDDNLPGQVPSEDVYRFTWGEFATLSYNWGDPNNTVSIYLNGEETKVRKNLAAALRAFRKLNYFHGRYKLWIDAICINQHDNQERSAQVARMRDIYDGSWTTVTWLGEAADDSYKAIELLKTLTQYEARGESVILKEKLQEQPEYLGVGKWMALHTFLQRSYWSRLWIIQEVALAPKNMLMFVGEDSITWQQIYDGLGVIHTTHWYVKDACLRNDRRVHRMIRGLEGEDSPVWNTENLHHIDKDIAGVEKKELRGEGLPTFTELLYTANGAQASQPLDKVYGLLAIMDPVISQHIIPDYTIKPSKLFAQVAHLYISHSRNLEIIRDGNPWGNRETPTWAPDWLWTHRGRDKDNPQLRYTADANRPWKCSFSPDLSLLTVDAIFIDTIDGLGASACPDDATWYNFLPETVIQPRKFRSAYGSVSSTHLAFHRTLIGDRRGHSGAQRSLCRRNLDLLGLPGSAAAATAEFQRRGWTEFAIQGQRYLHWENWREVHQSFWLGEELGRMGDMFTDEILKEAELGPIWEVYVRFRNVATGRRFVTTEGGRFGWVPDNASGRQMDQVRGGDFLVVVLGCTVPLVVRKYRDGMYQLLGDSYVQGFMDGEALQMVDDGNMKVERLTFC